MGDCFLRCQKMQQAFKKQQKHSVITMYKTEKKNRAVNMRATAAQLLLSSQTSCRVLLIGLVFSILHTAGILVSAYLMTDRILEPDLHEKPQFHISTEALFCPFYVILTGLPGITVQIVGSTIGLLVNMNLVFCVFYAMSCGLVVWLVVYSINISGCFVLFGTVISILMKRKEEEGDVSSSTMMICLVPLILAVLYIVCWCFVFKLWRKVRDRDNQVFICVE